MLCYRPQRILLVLAVGTNILMLFYLAYLQDTMHFMQEDSMKTCLNKSSEVKQHEPYTSKMVVIIRQFEQFDNDVTNLVERMLEYFSDEVSVLVVADDVPYPPLSLPSSARANIMTLATKLESSLAKDHLTHWINSEFILLVPDGVQLVKTSDDFMDHALMSWNRIPEGRGIRMIAWSVDSTEHVHCLGLNVNTKQWTLQYFRTSGYCDALSGKFVLLLKQEDFLNLPKPLSLPVQDSLFIQTALRGWKIHIEKTLVWMTATKLYQDPHAAWKHKDQDKKRRVKLFEDFGIKLVQRPDGDEEWFGCNKESQRCFGTIINAMPDFLYKGRWTPPCCLKAVRTTARHVFRILDQQKVRYWLEGGSLLGAARNGDIIPWDYDVDIGIYKDDISLSSHLMNCLEEPYEDEDGFVWEKATEGDFCRVQYSASNHLHVDIFPFYSKNGTMTKDTWFESHRQDMPFPEHYLKPLEKINFFGVEASAPNNYKEFLELKFGEDAISNPKYPDDSYVKQIEHI